MNIEKKLVKTIDYTLQLSENEFNVLICALGSVGISTFRCEYGENDSIELSRIYNALREQSE